MEHRTVIQGDRRLVGIAVNPVVLDVIHQGGLGREFHGDVVLAGDGNPRLDAGPPGFRHVPVGIGEIGAEQRDMGHALDDGIAEGHCHAVVEVGLAEHRDGQLADLLDRVIV